MIERCYNFYQDESNDADAIAASSQIVGSDNRWLWSELWSERNGCKNEMILGCYNSYQDESIDVDVSIESSQMLWSADRWLHARLKQR